MRSFITPTFLSIWLIFEVGDKDPMLRQIFENVMGAFLFLLFSLETFQFDSWKILIVKTDLGFQTHNSQKLPVYIMHLHFSTCRKLKKASTNRA